MNKIYYYENIPSNSIIKIGIYKITNQYNNKVYIGQSKNIYKRWRHHCYEAYAINSPQFSYYFNRAIRKYGINSFIFEILEECNIDMLDEKEIFYIQQYQSNRLDIGYNIRSGGAHGGLVGSLNGRAKLSEEDVKEIRNRVMNGEFVSTIAPDFIDKISYHGIQRVISYETWKHIMPEYANYIKSNIYLQRRRIQQAFHGSNEKYEIIKDILKRKYQGELPASIYKDYADIWPNKQAFYCIYEERKIFVKEIGMEIKYDS